MEKCYRLEVELPKASKSQKPFKRINKSLCAKVSHRPNNTNRMYGNNWTIKFAPRTLSDVGQQTAAATGPVSASGTPAVASPRKGNVIKKRKLAVAAGVDSIGTKYNIDEEADTFEKSKVTGSGEQKKTAKKKRKKLVNN